MSDPPLMIQLSNGHRFGWVTLQLDSLEKNCLGLRVLKRSLRNLPGNLFETYDRIIQNMDENYRDLALLALQWLIYSDMPMSIEVVSTFSSFHSPAFENRLFNMPDPLCTLKSLWRIAYRSM